MKNFEQSPPPASSIEVSSLYHDSSTFGKTENDYQREINLSKKSKKIYNMHSDSIHSSVLNVKSTAVKSTGNQKAKKNKITKSGLSERENEKIEASENDHEIKTITYKNLNEIKNNADLKNFIQEKFKQDLLQQKVHFDQTNYKGFRTAFNFLKQNIEENRLEGCTRSFYNLNFNIQPILVYLEQQGLKSLGMSVQF